MDLKDKLKRLVTDAVSVWRDPHAKRPFTRRGVSEEELLDGYKRFQRGEDDTIGAADAPRPDNPGRQ